MNYSNEAVEMNCNNNGVYCEHEAHEATIAELLASVPRDPRYTPEFIAAISIITPDDLITMAREEEEIRLAELLEIETKDWSRFSFTEHKSIRFAIHLILVPSAIFLKKMRDLENVRNRDHYYKTIINYKIRILELEYHFGNIDLPKVLRVAPTPRFIPSTSPPFFTGFGLVAYFVKTILILRPSDLISNLNVAL